MTEDTSMQSPGASFVGIFKREDGEIKVAACESISQSGHLNYYSKLVGGTWLQKADGSFENPREALMREVMEETGGDDAGRKGIVLIRKKKVYEEVIPDALGNLHTRMFFFAVRWKGEISIPHPDPREESPAFWQSLYYFRRRLLPTHVDGFNAILEEACRRNEEFKSLLLEQRSFQSFCEG